MGVYHGTGVLILKAIIYYFSNREAIMRKFTMAAGISFLFLLAITMGAYAADVAKIGVVDFQKVLEISSAGKAAQAKIKEKGKEMEAQLKKKGGEIEEAKKKLEREALVMNKEMRMEKEREIRIDINDFKALQRKYMSDFKNFEKNLVQKIQRDVTEIVKNIGSSEGFLLIVEKREGGIVYYPSSLDITDAIIKQYNLEFAKQ
jgi:outer membrane protein